MPAPFPKVLGDGPLGARRCAVNLALIGVSKTLFSYQIYVEAETTPDVDFVLRDAKEKSAFREQLARREARQAEAARQAEPAAAPDEKDSAGQRAPGRKRPSRAKGTA